MARIINLDGALKPSSAEVDCADCLHFYKKGRFASECRECRWFPYRKGNVKNNFVFAIRLRRGWLNWS